MYRSCFATLAFFGSLTTKDAARYTGFGRRSLCWSIIRRYLTHEARSAFSNPLETRYSCGCLVGRVGSMIRVYRSIEVGDLGRKGARCVCGRGRAGYRRRRTSSSLSSRSVVLVPELIVAAIDRMMTVRGRSAGRMS